MNFSNLLRFLLVTLLLLVLPGCYFLGKNQRIVRIWADYNTLRAPALFVEQMSHRPYDPIRVVREQVLYNKPPDPPVPTQPIPVGQIMPAIPTQEAVIEQNASLQPADPILVSPTLPPVPPQDLPPSPFDVEILMPPAPEE